MKLANLSLALGRRPTPPLPPPPLAARGALLGARAAYNRQIGCIASIKNPDTTHASISTRFVKNPKGTIFVFGGLMNGMLGLSTAKLVDMLKNARKDIVLVRDFHQTWFQNGLAGGPDSRDKMEEFIHDHLGDCPRPWTFLGSGTGGYAALYFGLSFEANKIRAFSPQTIIDRQAFDFFVQDTPDKWGFKMDDPQNDILNHPELGHPRCEVAVYYANRSGPDFQQAERLRGTSNTVFIPVDTTNHDCAVALRQAAKLRVSVR